jgi:hypothetical protein
MAQTSTDSDCDVVTALSHAGADTVKRWGTAADCFHWSADLFGRRGPAENGLCPTGGQVVAGSNPVSPTQRFCRSGRISLPYRSLGHFTLRQVSRDLLPPLTPH